MDCRVYYRDPVEPRVIGPLSYDSARDPLSPTIFGYLKRFPLLAICCEPGYCSESCLREVAMLAARSGMQTFSRDFSKMNSASATDALVKFTRVVRTKARATQMDVFVLIAGLPASDESEVVRQGAALEKLISSGCSVVCTMLPEARQLLEEISDFGLLTSEDLCEPPFDACGLSDDTLRLTHGIPVLSRSIDADSQPDSAPQLNEAYLRELARLTGLSLRAGLSDDEIRVRLCMVILGEGGFDDIDRAVGFDSAELLADAAIWAPFFGVSYATRTFGCLAGVSGLWLGDEAGRIDELTKRFPDVARAAMLILGERGSFDRVERFIGHVPQETSLEVVEKYGPELLDSGSIGAVAQVVASAPKEWGERLLLLRSACEALGSERLGGGNKAIMPSALPSCDEASMLCVGLIGLRGALRAEKPGCAMIANSPSGLQQRLYAHAQAVELMLSGNFMLALEGLVPVVGQGSPDMLTGHVLMLDMAIAKAMACGDKWSLPADVRECETYFRDRGYLGLLGYVWACDLLFAALSGEGANRECTVLRAKATKSGDRLVKTLSLATEAASLLKKKPSAYIAAAIGAAESSCGSVGWGYAARVMRIFGQVARFRLGERNELREVTGSDALGVVSVLVHDACCDAMGDNPLVKQGEGCPRDAMWLLVFLSVGLDEFSDALDEQVPAEWRRTLEMVRRSCLPALCGYGEGVSSDKADAHGADEVRINVLGEFSLWVGGRRVSERNLVARDAMRLLEYLALQNGHLAGRRRLACDLWPDVTDERKALQKVYSATSTVRKALDLHGYEDELFISNRVTSVISLSTEGLACDVDEFLEFARAAQDGISDSKSCSAALRAEALYTGDLFVSANEGSDYFDAAREGLRKTYVDAMVAGGEAALRLDKKRLAVRLAGNAIASDDLREDAAALLVRSLRSVGRGTEALRAYQAYEKRLLDEMGVEPSRQMKRALNEPIVTVVPPSANRPPRASAG